MVHTWLVVKAVSDAGDAAWIIAVGWTAVNLAGPPLAGLVVAAGTIPRACILLIGGVVADRFDVRRILAVTTAARVGVLIATICFAVGLGETVVLLFIAAVAFGVCDAVFEPASTTLARQVVRDGDLGTYQGLSQSASRLGAMVGAACGGGLVAIGGLPASAAANMLTYLGVLGFLIFRLRVRFPMPRAEPEPVVRAILTGLKHLRSEASTRTLVVALLGVNLFVGPALGLGIVLRVSQEEWSAATLGVLQSLVGVGALCGAAFAITRKPRRPARCGFALLLIQGIAIGGLAIPTLYAVAVACVVIGLTAGAASALLSGVFMRTVAAEFLGRMASIQRLGDDCLMPLAMVGFGMVGQKASVAVAFMMFGGLMCLLVVVALQSVGSSGLDSSSRTSGEG